MRMWPVWRAGMSEMISFSSVVVLAEARLVRRVEIWEDKVEACFSSESSLGLGLFMDGSLLPMCRTVEIEEADFGRCFFNISIARCNSAASSLQTRDVENGDRAVKAVNWRLDGNGIRHAFCPTDRTIVIVL